MSAQTSKQTSRRQRLRKGSSVALASETLEELMKASEIVPTGSVEFVCKHVAPPCCESANTTAPPSTEQSPLFSFNAADPLDIEAPAWPSLREALSGWDFCSEASDGEDTPVKYDDAPEENWCLVTDDPSPLELESNANETGIIESRSAIIESKSASYADRLQGAPKPSVFPAAHGTLASTFPVDPFKRSGSASSANKGIHEDEKLPCDHVDSRDIRVHGWRKKDKAPRNRKQQNKVVDRTARRLNQSMKDRGWLKEEEEEEQ